MIRFVEESQSRLSFRRLTLRLHGNGVHEPSHRKSPSANSIRGIENRSRKQAHPLPLFPSLSLSRAHFFHFQIFEVEAARARLNGKWKIFKFSIRSSIFGIQQKWFSWITARERPRHCYVNHLYHRVVDIYVTFTLARSKKWHVTEIEIHFGYLIFCTLSYYVYTLVPRSSSQMYERYFVLLLNHS